MTGKCYKSLSSLISEARKSRLSVCIVTPDLLGPVKNGGIGTACTYLAYALADAGHKVEILFSQSGFDTKQSTSWCKEYESRNIKVSLPTTSKDTEYPKTYFPNHPPLYMALMVHDWLAAQSDFDLILFMEWQGSGFYALHARKCGLRFLNTVMAVVVHSPSIWHSTNNAAAPTNPIEACTWHMERRCIEMADAVISPSAYMLNWCQVHDFHLPEHSYVQPNLLEWPIELTSNSRSPINEIVFFGRLEYRKGLEQFCAALDILAKRGTLPSKVTFLGKCAWMGNEHCLLYIARRSQKWKNCQLSFLLHYDHYQAVSYLCAEGRLAVMPSVADNSPYTVYECLVAGIPFLARNVGGIPELINEEDHNAILFRDNPRILADKIEKQCGKSPYRAAIGFDRDENMHGWCEGLVGLTARVRDEYILQEGKQSPFISVCLVHYNRPHLLVQALESLRNQDYPYFEVILADDGSTAPEASRLLDSLESEFSQRGWQILRLDNGYPARARNMAAKCAKGEWLLFLDDDNVAKPNMLTCFARAAQTHRTGFISTSFDVFEGLEKPSQQKITERFLPLGDIVAYSIIHNTLGDTTSLINRKSFERVNGFREDYGLGHEDFEIFLRMVLAGETVGVIPDSLFWYRRASAKTSVQTGTSGPANRMRSLRPFMECYPATMSELALMTHGMAVTQGFFPTVQSHEGDETASIRHRSGDPQSDTILSQVASHLEAIGQYGLAEQVFSSLEDNATFATSKINILALHARHAAKNKDIKLLKKRITAFEDAARKLPREEQIESCNKLYIQLLYILPILKSTKELRSNLIKNIANSGVDSIPVNLCIASCASRNNIDESVLHFFKALRIAEKNYLTSRPDVAEALSKGEFFCALQHYALHGRMDNMEWPEAHAFSKTLSYMNSLISTVCQTHRYIYKYTDIKLSEMLIHSLQEKK